MSEDDASGLYGFKLEVDRVILGGPDTDRFGEVVEEIPVLCDEVRIPSFRSSASAIGLILLRLVEVIEEAMIAVASDDIETA